MRYLENSMPSAEQTDKCLRTFFFHCDMLTNVRLSNAAQKGILVDVKEVLAKRGVSAAPQRITALESLIGHSIPNLYVSLLTQNDYSPILTAGWVELYSLARLEDDDLGACVTREELGRAASCRTLPVGVDFARRSARYSLRWNSSNDEPKVYAWFSNLRDEQNNILVVNDYWEVPIASGILGLVQSLSRVVELRWKKESKQIELTREHDDYIREADPDGFGGEAWERYWYILRSDPSRI